MAAGRRVDREIARPGCSRCPGATRLQPSDDAPPGSWGNSRPAVRFVRPDRAGDRSHAWPRPGNQASDWRVRGGTSSSPAASWTPGEELAEELREIGAEFCPSPVTPRSLARGRESRRCRPRALWSSRRAGQQCGHVTTLYPDSREHLRRNFGDKVMGVNLKGPFRLTALIGKADEGRRLRSIVNISSIGAYRVSGEVAPLQRRQGGLECSHQPDLPTHSDPR